MKQVKWWHFWNPGSGVIGGVITGLLIIFLLIFAWSAE